VVRAQWLIPLQRRSEVESLPLDGVQLSPATAPGMPGTLFVSITREGVSKGSAVRQLAEAMKVPLSSVLAIGDSEGDAPMLDLVGYPVVMGNAPESLRQRYPNVAGLVDECGVVPALEEALRLRPPQGAA